MESNLEKVWKWLIIKCSLLDKSYVKLNQRLGRSDQLSSPLGEIIDQPKTKIAKRKRRRKSEERKEKRSRGEMTPINATGQLFNSLIQLFVTRIKEKKQTNISVCRMPQHSNVARRRHCVTEISGMVRRQRQLHLANNWPE